MAAGVYNIKKDGWRQACITFKMDEMVAGVYNIKKDGGRRV